MTTFVKLKISIASFLAVIFGMITVSQADTLNFLEWETAGVPVHWTGENALSLSNAFVKSFGADIYYAGAGGFAESNNLGTVGSCNGYYCNNDLEITFNNAVSNLSFDAVAVGDRDIIKISAFNGTNNVGEMTLKDLSAPGGVHVDFSSFGNITRLLFDDMDSFDGALYNDFNFNSAEISAVPLPAGLPLYAAGLGILGLMGWRRRNNQ